MREASINVNFDYNHTKNKQFERIFNVKKKPIDKTIIINR